MQSVLGYWGIDEREEALAKSCKSDRRKGTAYRRLAKYAEDKGFKVDIIKGMKLEELKSWLDKRIPVVCLIQAWPGRKVDFSTDWEDGHYVVAVGYDAEQVFFMDPSTLGHYTSIPIKQFLERWHDTDGKEKLYNFGMVLSREVSPRFDANAVVPLD